MSSRVEADGLKRRLNQYKANLADLPMEKIGAYVVQEIIERTQSGKDVRDHAFTPYKHPDKRTKRGRQSGHVDLNSSGNMLGALSSKVEGKRVEIYFGGLSKENAKAHGHNNGSKWLPKREFFGLGKIKTGVLKLIKQWL